MHLLSTSSRLKLCLLKTYFNFFFNLLPHVIIILIVEVFIVKQKKNVRNQMISQQHNCPCNSGVRKSKRTNEWYCFQILCVSLPHFYQNCDKIDCFAKWTIQLIYFFFFCILQTFSFIAWIKYFLFYLFALYSQYNFIINIARNLHKSYFAHVQGTQPIKLSISVSFGYFVYSSFLIYPVQILIAQTI